MEDTIILNTNGMLPNGQELEKIKEQNKESQIADINHKLDELLNVKRILKTYYNYDTDDAHELENFIKAFTIPNNTKYFSNYPSYNTFKKEFYFPNINNEIHKIGIINISWSDKGLEIKGKDLHNYKLRKIFLKKITKDNGQELFLCTEDNIARPIDIKLYPDVYATYLDFERKIESSNQIIMTYQNRFNTLKGLAFLDDEVTRFIAYSANEYPIDNLFALCFKIIMQNIPDYSKNLPETTKEYLNYVIEAYASYLFCFEEIKTWNKYLLDGYIKDQNGEWVYHDRHYSQINPLTFNHYIPMVNEKAIEEIKEICQTAVNKKKKDCSYRLKIIKNANLLR